MYFFLTDMGVKSRRMVPKRTKPSLVTRKFRVKMINRELKSQVNLDESEVKLKKCVSVALTGRELSGRETLEGFLKSNINGVEKIKTQADNADEMPAQCEFCGKKYKNDKRLKDHLRFCHPKIFHKCIICSQQFPKKWILNTHMRKHTSEFPYTCSSCGQKFISSSKLQTHLNFHHKLKELTCTICNAFGFYTKQDLGNHIRTKHTRERAFQCGVCNKSFMSSSVYYQHRIIHTDLKKYLCTICSRSFQRWSTLHNHLRIHRNELPFLCDVCRLPFRQRGDVKKHKLNQHSNLKV